MGAKRRQIQLPFGYKISKRRIFGSQLNVMSLEFLRMELSD
jgi:hypothetical protein